MPAPVSVIQSCRTLSRHLHDGPQRSARFHPAVAETLSVVRHHRQFLHRRVPWRWMNADQLIRHVPLEGARTVGHESLRFDATAVGGQGSIVRAIPRRGTRRERAPERSGFIRPADSMDAGVGIVRAGWKTRDPASWSIIVTLDHRALISVNSRTGSFRPILNGVLHNELIREFTLWFDRNRMTLALAINSETCKSRQ